MFHIVNCENVTLCCQCAFLGITVVIFWCDT